MATTATVRQSRALKPHRLIERPRLYALLDESQARIKTLVAPAGYGKSTLAEQWIARDGRRGAWFRARPASADVAALALGVARASTAFVPECDERLREHLRALPTPAENVETLAEILGEDLAPWPSDAWLVLDEYQELARAEAAERFVAALINASPMQLLIASRQRPSWSKARDVVYEDVLELGQSTLAMDSTEAAEVLTGRTPQSAAGLVEIANGWPAVIGLASVSSAELTEEAVEVPESLYGFFAEEIFVALGHRVQTGLRTLAIAPILDRELAGRLLGDDDAELVCGAARDVGVLVEREAQLELHPLARSFLEERSDRAGFVAAPETLATCFDHYWERRDWDAAFELIVRRESVERLAPLLKAALDELLETARLSTIDTWCAFGTDFGLDGPVFRVARAEVALRHGRHAEAQTHAESAAEEGSDMKFRALCVAGRAAHLASREEEGLELYRRAEAAAENEGEVRDALWGQFICSVELEAPHVPEMLMELSAGVVRSDVREVVRASAYRLSYQVKFGCLDLSEADVAYELVPSVRDPLVVSSFQSTYSAVLGLVARYDEALEVANELLDTAERYRLEFARPYALCSAGLAHAGMRQWRAAQACLEEALARTRAVRDRHAYQLAYALYVRILAQQGRHHAAIALEVPSVAVALPAARAEVLFSRALVLASIGRTAEALRISSGLRGSTGAVEPAVLVPAIDAIVALRDGGQDLGERTRELEDAAFATGAVDILITAYRSTPELLSVLYKVTSDRDRLSAVIRRIGDSDVARAAGQPVDSDLDPRALLTPREREVLELMCDGLTNLQIAKLLFISESTVKRHTHNIYGKLGTRSRRALAVQAVLERADQATSAMTTNESSDES